MNIFKKANEDLSAKDFIEKKRNQALYLDCTDTTFNNNKAKKIAWNSNSTNYISTITSFNNHSNRIKITKGYFNHLQDCKNDSSYFTKHTNTQEFKYKINDNSYVYPDNGNATYVNVQGDIIAHPEMLSNDPHFNFDRNYVKIGSENNSGDVNKVSQTKIKCFDIGINIPIITANHWLKNEQNAMLSSVTYPFTKNTPEEEIGYTVETFTETNGTWYQLPLHINYIEQEDVTVKVVMQNKRVNEISIHSTTDGNPNKPPWDCNVKYGDLVKIDLLGTDDPTKTIILKLNFDALTTTKTNRTCF